MKVHCNNMYLDTANNVRVGVTGTGWQCLATAGISAEGKKNFPLSDRLYVNTVLQGRGTCLMWRPGRPAGIGILVVTTSHRPEQTLLYQIVDEYYPAFAALMAEQGKELPGYVQREFEEFLQCGRLEHGFLRVRCESCHAEHPVAFQL